MPYRTQVYKRGELYEQVWASPMLKVAATYGVSAVALAKMCRKLGVPVPGRGYWQRIEAGKPEPRVTVVSAEAARPHRADGEAMGE